MAERIGKENLNEYSHTEKDSESAFYGMHESFALLCQMYSGGLQEQQKPFTHLGQSFM